MANRRNLRWEDMDKESLELMPLIRHFESFNRSERKSPRTVDWYTYVLEFFHNWLCEISRPTNLAGIGEIEARNFILYLQERQVNGKNLSSHTIANRVRGLKGFFSWLAQEGYTDRNLLERVRVPRVDQKVVEPLSSEEIDRLFASINPDSALGARNTAIVALFVDTGLRLSELTFLKEQDVHLDDRYIKVMGKGSKERILPLGYKCQRVILHYHHHFRPDPAHSGVDALFLTLDGYPLSTKAVKSMVVRLSRAANVSRLHAHLFRHTYATWFLLNGGDVFLLKQNLGHTSLAMVEHYRHIASQLAAVASMVLSPLDRMDAPSLRRRRRSVQRGAVHTYPNMGRTGEKKRTRTIFKSSAQEAIPASLLRWRGANPAAKRSSSTS